MVSFV